MTRRVSFLAFFALFVFLTGAAAGAGGKKLRRTEIIVGGAPVTMVEYGGRTYRTISAADLAGKRLSGQPCCVEGKYKEYVGDRLYLFDVNASFPVAASLIRDLRPGDNVWLGGRVRSGRSRPGGGRASVLAVSAVVRLGSDIELFESRFARYRKKNQPEELVELGAWIKRAKEQSTRLDFREFERYDALRERALREALTLFESKLDEKDAEGFYRLGLRTIKLVNDKGAATRLFLRAAEAKPDHAGTTRRLAAAGYVRYGEGWVTAAERDRLIAEEKKQREAELIASSKAYREARAHALANAHAAAIQCAAIERDLARARRPAAFLLAALGGNKMLPEGRLYALELAARLPGKDAVEVLVAGAGAEDAVVRARGVDLLAVRTEPEARSALALLARKNADEATALRAVEALAWANDRRAREALVALLEVKRKPVAAAARAALVKLAGRDLGGIEAWKAWAARATE